MIVDTRTTYKDDLNPDDPYAKVLENKRTLFSYDNKVALVWSTQRTGINRHSNKRWFRWNTIRSFGFYTTSKGTIVPFDVTKDGRRFTPVYNTSHPFAALVENRTDGWGKFSAEVKDKFGVTGVRSIYPMVNHFEIEYSEIPKPLLGAFRMDNGRDFTEAIFGRKNMRKDLIKSTCNAQASTIAIGQAFKNLVPIDWVIDFMRTHPSAPGTLQIGKLRFLLPKLDVRSYRHLLNQDDLDLRFVGDACRLVGRVAEGTYVRSFQELHDTALLMPVKIEPPKNRKIKQTTIAKQLDGQHINGENSPVFKVAEDTNEMLQWGETMGNCIGSYANDAVSGYGLYAAVKQGDKIIANLEIKRDKLVQLLGRFNERLNDDIRNTIVTSLETYGVNTTDDWWGK